MSEEQKDLIERPNYLSNVDAGDDNDLMNQHCQPPRMKIIQSQTSAPFKPPFKDKDVIVIPQMTKVGGEGNPFSFTPIFFFPSWACWNPYKMKSQLPAIREFSLDSSSTVAKKAIKFIKEPCPENREHQLSYCKHLNFYCVVHGIEEVENTPIVFTWRRGEYKTGESLIGLIQTRKAPKYACRFQGIPADHAGNGEDWYGLDIINDSPMWVTDAQFEAYSKLSVELKAICEAKAIQIDHNDSDVEGITPAKSEF